MLPRPTIEAFDTFLKSRGLSFEATVIGGSGLALLGITERQTRDFDILYPDLPEKVLDAAQVFAQQMRNSDLDLDDNWLNNDPAPLGDVLPEGWKDRLQPAFQGHALVLTTLGRKDLLKSKLFALCDRGTDLSDCLALKPTSEELDEAEPWVAQQDAHPDWPTHVTATIEDLRARLHHGL